jgi:hypothetical protein
VTDYAGVTRTVQRVELDANGVLKQAWLLYKRLFTRSVLLGAAVFGSTHFLQALAASGRSGAGLTILAIVLSVAGVALVQGGLVEIVRGLHDDGDDDASVLEALSRASGRVLKLARRDRHRAWNAAPRDSRPDRRCALGCRRPRGDARGGQRT